MGIGRLQSGSRVKALFSVRRLYDLLAPHAYSVIMFATMFCTLTVKFFHSHRTGLLNEYFGWILADIAVLLAIEVILAVACFRWPRKSVIRPAIVIAAIMCAWSVMNASWLIRTGTQILPSVLLPLFRHPLNSFGIVGVNLAKMPTAAVILLAPSAVALTFFFFVLAKPQKPNYNRKRFAKAILISVIIIFITVLAHNTVARPRSPSIASAGLRYNSQLKAITTLFFSGSDRLTKTDLLNAKRKIPTLDRIQLALKPHRINHNVVIVVLEGVQYRYTSLADTQGNLTPYLVTLAEQGVEFANARSSLTHTTKVLFSLLTGRYPSVSQDLAEAVPAVKPYAGLAAILKQKLNFRTAFFQSAKGNFESRPALVYNLGFDKFWARDDLSSTDAFLGYLACDEFAMLKPITEWIKADQRPFFLTVLCSVTHDPYEVPDWFAAPAKEPIERYRQAIFYTDKFIAALDTELAKLNLTDKTIFCVIGDHGEAFGEHGQLGHERIAFDEVLHIPWIIRAPFVIQLAKKITGPLGSVDLTPTLLALLGFETEDADFDGVDALRPLPDDRKVYFSGWMRQSPAGYLKGTRKFIYNPTTKAVFAYDLSTDPLELLRIELPEQQAQEIADEIITWRNNSVFRLDQKQTGEKMLFDSWLCRWSNRVSSAKYRLKPKN